MNYLLRDFLVIQIFDLYLWIHMMAKMMEKAAEQRVHGLYNMVPDHNISKYELLKLFNH